MKKLIVAFVAVVLILTLIATGCAQKPEAREITVGNKNFTEQYIVGQLMKQLLEENGFKVNLFADLSTMALREGMESGDIDICADYTGTAWMVHLGHEYTPGIDNNKLYTMVKEEEAGKGFAWLDPMWNNNTYAMACWSEFAEKNNLTTLSDLAALYRASDGKINTFIDFEYSTRPDGLPALEKYYNFEVSEETLKTGAPGTSLLALEQRQTDVIMVFGTDPLIAKHGWHVFPDDRSFFPPYDLTPYVREEVLDMYPEIEDILNTLVATFPGGGKTATPAIVAEGQRVWQELNARVDIDKLEPDEMAREYLLSHGLVK